MKKYLISLLILLVFNLSVYSRTYGEDTYGNCPYGYDCASVEEISQQTQPGETPSGGGIIPTPGEGQCPEGTFRHNEFCFNETYKPLYEFLNTTIFSKWFIPQQGVLEYGIITPLQIEIPSQIEVKNIFRNEGDLDIEIHCINFLDLNKNGIIDINNEPTASFNKEATKNVLNQISVILNVPETAEEGIYLIAGQCEVPNQPNASAANKIVLKKKIIKEETEIVKTLKSKNVLLLFLLLGIILLHIVQYFFDEMFVDTFKKFITFSSISIVNLIFILLYLTFILKDESLLIFVLTTSFTLYFIHFLLDTDVILKFSKTANLLISLLLGGLFLVGGYFIFL